MMTKCGSSYGRASVFFQNFTIQKWMSKSNLKDHDFARKVRLGTWAITAATFVGFRDCYSPFHVSEFVEDESVVASFGVVDAYSFRAAPD